MRRGLFFLSLLLILACRKEPPSMHPASIAVTKSTPEQRTSLSGQRLFFGHQSVGQNILDGVQAIAAEMEGLDLDIREATEWPRTQGALLHAFVGVNTRPYTKIKAFQETLRENPGADMALMKFCYVDINKHSDPAAIFQAYQKALKEMQKTHPKTLFLHVACPLFAPPSGAKTRLKETVKKWIRRPDWRVDNLRRMEFNGMLRAAYGENNVFPLDYLEASGETGKIEYWDRSGKKIPALLPLNTTDGGHLNAQAQKRIGRAFVDFLAGHAPVR